MLKKLSIAFFAALLFAMVFSMTAYAAPCNAGGGDFTATVDRANDAIAQEIDKAISQANFAQSQYNDQVDKVNWMLKKGCIKQDEANRRLAFLQDQLDRTIDGIANCLIRKTECIANSVVWEGKRRGIEVEKIYESVVLAGHTYSVDPLRIVGN